MYQQIELFNDISSDLFINDYGDINDATVILEHPHTGGFINQAGYFADTDVRVADLFNGILVVRQGSPYSRAQIIAQLEHIKLAYPDRYKHLRVPTH